MPTEKWTDEELDMLTDEEREGLLEDENDGDGADDEDGDSAAETGGDTDSGDGIEGADGASSGEGKEKEADKEEDEESDDGDADSADAAGEKEKKQDEESDDKSGEEDEADTGNNDDEEGDGDGEAPIDDAPGFQPTAPANAKDRLTSIEAELDALDDKMDDGELTAKEFRQAERKLRLEQQDLREAMLKDSIAQDQAVATWRDQTVPDFLKEHAEYQPGSTLTQMLDAKVRQLQAKAHEDNANALSPSILARAHQALTQELQAAGLAPKPSAKPTQKPGGKKRELPPNLAEVPAADATDTDEGGEFSHLDKLDGVEFEEALGKLTDDQQERYFAAR